ncbi:unnamed protein product, partial [Polarella glacialis]
AVTPSPAKFGQGAVSSSSGPCYALRAIVSHEGSSPRSGHYVSYAQSESGAWRSYDDSLVRELPLGQEPQKQLGRKAYLLFYVLQGTPSP